MSEPKSAKLFVSGRLCLFGEHSDWAAQYGIHRGLCLVVGTDQGLWAEALPAEDFIVETPMPDEVGRPAGQRRRLNCSWDAGELRDLAGNPNEFFRYCAGVAYEMLTHIGLERAIHLRITAMDLPLKRGVSSSAAVCVLVAKAFNEVFRLNLLPHEIMELAYLGELRTGSQCGRMDQACIYGRIPVLLRFRKGRETTVEPLFPSRKVHMFFVDLAGSKDTVRILSDLRRAYPRSPELQLALGEQNEAIVRSACAAILAGDAVELGRLMTESQRLFDDMVAPHSPRELMSPLLHELLCSNAIAGHVHGGKGVGSQGDGTAQFVARSLPDREAAISRIGEAFPAMRCFPLTMGPG